MGARNGGQGEHTFKMRSMCTSCRHTLIQITCKDQGQRLPIPQTKTERDGIGGMIGGLNWWIWGLHQICFDLGGRYDYMKNEFAIENYLINEKIK